MNIIEISKLINEDIRINNGLTLTESVEAEISVAMKNMSFKRSLNLDFSVIKNTSSYENIRIGFIDKNGVIYSGRSHVRIAHDIKMLIGNVGNNDLIEEFIEDFDWVRFFIHFQEMNIQYIRINQSQIETLKNLALENKVTKVEIENASSDKNYDKLIDKILDKSLTETKLAK